MIITDPLANSFVGPVPKDAVALSLQAEKEGSNACYEAYVDPGMEMEEFERSHEQNEALGLNDMKTEGYGEMADYYGTDQMSEIPDRIRRLDVRGPDHPHEVGKAPVDGDTTVMGPKSANFSVPAMGQRGRLKSAMHVDDATHPAIDIHKVIRDFESQDESFIPSDEYSGHREGMVFKSGSQGQGYYKDVPMLELWAEKVGISRK